MLKILPKFQLGGRYSETEKCLKCQDLPQLAMIQGGDILKLKSLKVTFDGAPNFNVTDRGDGGYSETVQVLKCTKICPNLNFWGGIF